jgi:hypothetical protein
MKLQKAAGLIIMTMKYYIDKDAKTFQMIAGSPKDRETLSHLYRELGDGDGGNVVLKFRAASLKQHENSYILFEICREDQKDETSEYTL